MKTPTEALRFLRLLSVTIGLTPEQEALFRRLSRHIARKPMPTAKADDVQLTTPRALLKFLFPTVSI